MVHLSNHIFIYRKVAHMNIVIVRKNDIDGCKGCVELVMEPVISTGTGAGGDVALGIDFISSERSAIRHSFSSKGLQIPSHDPLIQSPLFSTKISEQFKSLVKRLLKPKFFSSLLRKESFCK
mmetsp:Transcript_23073/g.34410  ORF Transcript_23073/g.34410 Transcript_23073/m.34410 type:complete len:122 (+) Transcript_23073:269-634(+)